MKKILLITLLLIPFLGFSQTTKPVEGFLGIKFGTSKADVIAAVKAKGGIIAQEEKNFVGFSNVKLGHLVSAGLFVYFFNDQAYDGTFYFKAEVDDKTIEFYNDLVSQITDIYGTGKSFKNFRSTFHEGDGYEITAIQQGDADYLTFWVDKNTIEAKIDTKLNIMLIYQDAAMVKLAHEAQKAKEKGDF